MPKQSMCTLRRPRLREKISLLAALLFGQLCSFAQSAAPVEVSGRVVDSKDLSPIPFAYVLIEGQKGGTMTDIDGLFSLKVPDASSKLTVSYVGYKRKTLPANQASVVKLERAEEVLDDIVITAGENPALRIIRQTEKHRAQNNPLGLESFQYSSYNKLLLTINVDSLKTEDEQGQPDSSAIATKRFIDRSHLFLMESITERNYIKGSRDNERVLASRISGLQRADFALIGTQLQSLSFYPDELEILFTRFINPIGPGAGKHYWYQIRDSLIGNITLDPEGAGAAISVPDTVYGIEFAPIDPNRTDLMRGYLSIGSADWSLRNAKAQVEDTSGFSIKLQQRYERFGKTWFTTQLLTDMELSAVSVNKAPLVGIGRTYLSDIRINPELVKKDIPRVELSLDDASTKREDEFWQRYRTQPLDSVERGTYTFIDSVGQELNLDRWVMFGQALFEKKVRLGSIDFEINRLLRFNVFELVRLGAGLRTNRQFSTRWTLGGFAGYGFGDQAWKAGLDARFSPAPDGVFSFGIAWKQEIEVTGAARYALERERGLLDFTNSAYTAELYDRIQRWTGDLSWEILPNVHTRLSASWEVRINSFDRYFEPPENPVELRSTFYSTSFDLHWAPADRYAQGPYGRRRIRKGYPVWDVSLSYATPDISAGQQALNENVLTAWAQYQMLWKNLRWGDTRLHVAAGAVDLGNAPYGFLLAANSNFRASNPSRFGLGSPMSFEAMVNNEFMLERIVQVHLRHDAPGRWTKWGSWEPTIGLAQGIGLGWLNRNSDQTIGFKSMDSGYFETGLELNNLFSGSGVGIYYRYGAYTLPEPIDNWAFKLTYAPPF